MQGKARKGCYRLGTVNHELQRATSSYTAVSKEIPLSNFDYAMENMGKAAISLSLEMYRVPTQSTVSGGVTAEERHSQNWASPHRAAYFRIQRLTRGLLSKCTVL